MENIEKTFQEILLAEQEAQKIIEEGKQEALEFNKKATLKAAGLREKTMKKLQDEKEVCEQEFLQDRTKMFNDMQKNSKAQISKLQKKCDSKKEEIAEQIVREILVEWQ